MARRPEPDRSAAILVALYEEAARRIKAELRKALRAGKTDAAANLRAIGKLERILADLRLNSEGLPLRVVTDAYLAAIQWIDDRLGEETPPAERIFTAGSAHRDAVEVIALELDRKLQRAVRTVGRRAQDTFRQAGLEEVGTGLARRQRTRETARQLSKRLEDEGLTAYVDTLGRRWKLDVYSRMVARTTAKEAVTVATSSRLLENGRDLVTISSHAHKRDICTPFDGKTFSLTGTTRGYPRATKLPPYHPNAIFEGTEVESVGELRGGVRAHWRGPVVHLATASGIRLTIGPNHPVLTGRGWVVAQELREGDDVIRRAGGQSNVLADIEDDLDDVPTFVEEVFDAMLAVGVGARISASPAYLHGDGSHCEGEIDVVRTDGLLLDELRAAGQPLRESALMVADAELPSLTGGGSLAARLPRVGAAVGRSLPDLDAPMTETTKEGCCADAQFCADLLSRFSIEVALDQLIEVRYVDGGWTGHAFDLETEGGTYFANELYISNCRHVVLPGPKPTKKGDSLEDAMRALEGATSRADVEQILGVRFP